MFRFRTYRPDRALDMLQLEQIRAVIKRSRQLLAGPAPDTFAGRKTQEPFPQEDEEHTALWTGGSKEMKPPE